MTSQALNYFIAIMVGSFVVAVVISHILHRTSFKKGDKIQHIAEEKWHNHPILEVLEVGEKNYLVKLYGAKNTKSFELPKSKSDKYRKVKTWADVR
jgi:hypothetical protein